MVNNTIKPWVSTGVVFGFVVTVVYPSMLFISFPLQITLVLAFIFAISLAIASIGLYKFISLNKNTVSAEIGVIFNIIACSVVFIMFALQLSFFNKNPGLNVSKDFVSYVNNSLNIIQLTLDVAWDMFLATGTILFSFNMFTHPKFGKVFSISGIILGLSLFILNVYYFPIPPAESGSIDMGPFVALWYLAITIKTVFSLKWIDVALSQKK